MKIALICFTNKYFNTNLKVEKDYLYSLHQNTVYPTNVILLEGSDLEGFKKVFYDSYDVVFIGNSRLATFSIRESLKEKQIFLDENGVFSGENFVAILEGNSTENTDFVISKMREHFTIYHEKVVFKLFGVKEEKIVEVTDRISQKYPSAYFHTKTENLDSKTVLIFDSRAPKTEVDKAIKEFLLTFKNNIYAEDDVKSQTRLIELLKLRRLTISTAESMTGGKIASKIVSVRGASQYFYEGLVTYNTLSKEERLGVDHNVINSYGVVSSQVAFEMAKGLLKTGNCLCAISITGYASDNIDNPEKKGLCYIGIGIKDSIQVYEYKFEGTREEIIEQASNGALFLMIKSITNL